MLCKLKVEGQTLRWYGEPEVLAADSIEFVGFEFILPDDWDGYTLHATFQQADKAYTQVLEDRKCTLPSEIGVGNCGIGLFGYQPGKSPRATTNLLNVQVVPSGFIPDGEYPVPPTPDLYSQLLSQLDSKVDEAEQFAVSAVQAAQQAQSHANQVKSEADLVVKLADDVDKKATQASDSSTAAAQAKEAAETAKRLAEEAQGAAETARTAAEAAQAAAEQSSTDAAGAKQAAEAALKATQDAAAAAAKALADIRALYQEMQTWAQGVIQDVNDAGSVAVRSVQSAGDAQVQRVTDEATHAGNIQVERVKSEGSKYAQMAVDAAKVAQDKAAEIAGKSDQIEANTVGLNELKQDLTGLQTVVDSKADKTDLAKTNLYLDALYKLNKGQTYDVLEQESKAYSVDVPSGAKYVGIDKVGGKSVVWNQIAKTMRIGSSATVTNLGDGTKRISFGVAGSRCVVSASEAESGLVVKPNHKYLYWLDALLETATYLQPQAYATSGVTTHSSKGIETVGVWDRAWCIFSSTIEQIILPQFHNHTNENLPHDFLIKDYDVPAPLFDLTQMFGAGNEPSTVEEFEAMFPADYYPYSDPTIISSQTDRVDVASADGTITQQITTGFPILNSAGSVYDYIDLNEGKLHQRVGKVDLGTLKWRFRGNASHWVTSLELTIIHPKFSSNSVAINGLSNKYTIDTADKVYNRVNPMSLGCEDGSKFTCFNGSDTEKPSGLLYYELAEEIVTDITIPTELTDWLAVEAGGSITFHNTDDGKRLLIPNKLSFVRKLDEVTV